MRRTKNFLAILLAVMICLTAFPVMASANPGQISFTENWGNARWIWSSADADRGPATEWSTNAFQSFIIDDATGKQPSGSTAINNYDDLAAEENVWMNFRRDFTLNDVPLNAPVKIAADSKYWM